MITGDKFMNKIVSYILGFTALLMAFVAPLEAQLKVDINRGTVDPVPIAVPEFAPVVDVETSTGRLSDIGYNISQVISSNLISTGLFRTIDEAAFIEKITASNTPPRFPAWRPLGAQALVTGRLEMLQNGNLRVEFRLWDVVAEVQMEGVGYTTPVTNWRRIAHVIGRLQAAADVPIAARPVRGVGAGERLRTDAQQPQARMLHQAFLGAADDHVAAPLVHPEIHGPERRDRVD